MPVLSKKMKRKQDDKKRLSDNHITYIPLSFAAHLLNMSEEDILQNLNQKRRPNHMLLRKTMHEKYPHVDWRSYRCRG